MEDEQGRPLNILLVEDNQADIIITLRAFAKARYKNDIFVVNDGQEALDYVYRRGKYQDAKKYPVPNIILLDIKIPKRDGFQVLKEIKGNQKYAHIPVIMLTSSGNEQDVIRSYRLFAASFIRKPVDYEDFIKFVDGFNFYWQVMNRLPESEHIS